MPLSSVSFFKPFILLFGFIAIVIFSKLNTKSRKKMNNELLFLFSRYVLLNIIFVFIYYFFCNDKSDWEYEKHCEIMTKISFFMRSIIHLWFPQQLVIYTLDQYGKTIT